MNSTRNTQYSNAQKVAVTTPTSSRWKVGALVAACILGVATASLIPSRDIEAQVNRVTFPAGLDRMVHYTTVKRGDVTENMLTTQEAIDAIKLGLPVPNGTHMVLADYRDGKIFRYFVMQKGADWGRDYEVSRRTGD